MWGNAYCFFKEAFEMKKFFAEFREFISRGNAMSMAIGVIIGGAFTALVNSLVNDLINPFLGLITGGFKFDELSFGVGDAQFLYGAFITAVINFLLTAFALFLIVKAMNKLHFGKKKEEEKPAEPSTKVCPFCKSEIDIHATRCPHCTSVLEEVQEGKAADETL